MVTFAAIKGILLNYLCSHSIIGKQNR